MIGGGQLGRMFAQEAMNLEVEVHCLDGDALAPCANVAHGFTQGSIQDYESVLQFGRNFDTITVEMEHVSIEALSQLEREGKKVYPQPKVLSLIKDKGLQKQFYQRHGIPTANFCLLDTTENTLPMDLPLVQKLCVGGYDGKGIKVIRSMEAWEDRFKEASILEEMVAFNKELSVIIARNARGEVRSFGAVECEFNTEANLVEFQFSPADILPEIEQEAQAIARKIIETLDMVGILAVEFFLTKDGRLLVNEIAPRPHNSGHHTLECCITSQFAQHLRAISNLPLGDTMLRSPGAMVNILGEKGHEGVAKFEGLENVLKIPGAYVHLYGKQTTKPFRKMGHVTLLGKDLEEIKTKVNLVKRHFRCIATQE
ncbi:MAG: 5-(carboxyamino)imidazole ribonucleotide synthase [Flavobacteriia bacterium]|nr:5-(carboxyamino)imidazole ribonucleotide synthase [Flavobacteriia bacterium]